MDFAQIVTIFCSMIAGGIAAVLWNWNLYRFYRDLQSRVYDLEERIISEIKKRAGALGRAEQTKEREMVDWAKDQAGTAKTAPTPVLKPLMEWRKEKMAGKQGA